MRSKKITVKQLQYLNMADENGVIDYRKYSEFKKQQQQKGYNIHLDKKDFKDCNDVNIIDNEEIIYDGKSFKPSQNEID